MALIILVSVGIAVFCFINKFYIIGIVCLFGISPNIGMVCLIATSIFLFIKGHWIVGAIPILVVAINIFYLLKKKKLKEIINGNNTENE